MGEGEDQNIAGTAFNGVGDELHAPRDFLVILGPENCVRRITLNFQFMGGCPWRVKKELNSPLNGLKFSKVRVLYSNGMRENTSDDA
ncbi:Uncharacterized protein TCM_001670 [Theobroma cacao]|uniref:Uncharacterized protein n=1 Tax=Theobroma cacao TaxID=3641 RepID=A0A061DK78_THECC|nr:Uncharacterized protein TCM_001670 [Theobroma cacao]